MMIKKKTSGCLQGRGPYLVPHWKKNLPPHNQRGSDAFCKGRCSHNKQTPFNSPPHKKHIVFNNQTKIYNSFLNTIPLKSKSPLNKSMWCYTNYMIWFPLALSNVFWPCTKFRRDPRLSIGCKPRYGLKKPEKN